MSLSLNSLSQYYVLVHDAGNKNKVEDSVAQEMFTQVEKFILKMRLTPIQSLTISAKYLAFHKISKKQTQTRH